MVVSEPTCICLPYHLELLVTQAVDGQEYSTWVTISFKRETAFSR